MYEIPKELRVKYLERRWDDLKNCQEALSNKDFDFLSRLGHQLKGNAATYGFEQLGLLAIRLEESAKLKNMTEITSILNLFKDYLQNIKLK